MKDIADMNVKSRSEVTSVDEFQYIVLPNGKKRYYREPDMSRMDRKTANIIYNALENREPYDAKMRELKKQVKKQNAELQALAEKGMKI